MTNDFCTSDAPDVLVSNTDGADSFNAAGIRFEMIEAMRRWRIVFCGLAAYRYAGDGVQPSLRVQKGVQSQVACSEHVEGVVARQEVKYIGLWSSTSRTRKCWLRGRVKI